MRDKKNVILVVLDCVRKESLSCYEESFSLINRVLAGGVRTPNIDEIARDGTVFKTAIVQASYTPASHASIFTGLNPTRHGIRTMIGSKLNPEVKTIQEILKEYGYTTAGFIASHALHSSYGLNRGFELYDEDFEGEKNWVLGYRRPAREVTYKSLRWLKEHYKHPFFVFIHYFDAHDVGGRSNTRFRQIRKVKKIDREWGKILSFLKEKSIYEDSIIVITSDHGDSFGEHNEYNHREYLFDTTLVVPLIIKGIGHLKGRKIEKQVRSVDIPPTILDLLGIDTEIEFDGKSLVDIEREKADRIAYLETAVEKSIEETTILKKRLIGVRTEKWKYFVDIVNRESYLFDLEKDPSERENLAYRKKEVIKNMEEILNGYLTHRISLEKLMNKEERKNIEQTLRGLGYL